MSVKSADRFKQPLTATLAKRAANRCSNPDCGAVTSGPSDDPKGSVNVGEAAHIYGAHVGSARFDAAMTSAARSDISNAIWLCGTCHKIIDDDERGYPAGLLFEWVKQHERQVARELGKAGALARQRYDERHLEEFGKLSYRAERILSEKLALWEYRLAEEVLRYEMAPVLLRWRALQRGLYMRPIRHLENAEFLSWVETRQSEIVHIFKAFTGLINNEFSEAWGPRGKTGNEQQIVSTCRLFVETCASALAWEETVKFAEVRGPLKGVHQLYVGVAGRMIDEAAKLPAWLAETFGENDPTGDHRLSLILDLPDGWIEAIAVAYRRAADAMRNDSEPAL